MLVDITLKITPKMVTDAQGNAKITLAGHLGTHFDVMNKEFPLEYTKRKAVVFDVSAINDRDIEASDIDISKVEKDMFVAFRTGYTDKVTYGTKDYFSEHPQLSPLLIRALVEKEVSIIGLDFPGIRRGAEHIPTDQYCADRGIFIIENLWGLAPVLCAGGIFTAYTFPLRCNEMPGLPCRVIAEIP